MVVLQPPHYTTALNSWSESPTVLKYTRLALEMWVKIFMTLNKEIFKLFDIIKMRHKHINSHPKAMAF